MIYRLEVFVRRARRWISRSEWAARLLGLPKPSGMGVARGLVMVQIDGLSRAQLERAIARGRMPFLQRLLDRERYQLHTLYSGLPSSTPAVQAELFYGVKGAVPAFSFRDHDSGRIVRMFEASAAEAVERGLDRLGKPLMKGGAVYLDVFTGGAEESHFCPSSVGWGPFLRAANPLALVFLFVTNAYSVVRLAILLVIELGLAIYDCLSGLIDGRDLASEIKFVPARAAISILLRDLVRIGAEIDLARGLPAIHLNFIGYDEQAHRRGPSSLFAHWTLKGIDDSIARVWHAARRSTRRDYDLWVYSDHGQEATLPYARQSGRTVQEAVAEVFARFEGGVPVSKVGEQRGIQSQRVRFLGVRKAERLFPVYRDAAFPDVNAPTVAAMGPLGFVYARRALSWAEKADLAGRLVAEAGIPLVMVTDGPDQLRAWTPSSELRLPDDAARVLGADHPFLDEVVRDRIDLCGHRDAGDFIISGWRIGATPFSFPIENGAHGGPGPEETRAFALLSGDVPLPPRKRGYLRPMDLRHAAFVVLGRRAEKLAAAEAAPPLGRQDAGTGRFRVMTYNVHSCVGMDGRMSPERIARVIAQHAPDVVALQELDVGRARTGGVDQAHLIARYLEMEFHFHPALRVANEQYGNAILTRLPMRPVRADRLPGSPRVEPRGAQWVAIETNGGEVQLINTHLGLWPGERRAQARALLGSDWLAHPECRAPVILVGDFNALPESPVCRMLHTRLHDAQAELRGHRPKKTLFGRYPSARIDHVFVDPGVAVDAVDVPKSELARTASDHLPLIVDLHLPAVESIPVND
jgi:endonuclease/exonuclease/phosphatase family metal-dependent hydrolase